MDSDAFTIKQVSTAGHEILDPDGNVVAWAVDGTWAALIVALLSRVEVEGLPATMRTASAACLPCRCGCKNPLDSVVTAPLC